MASTNTQQQSEPTLELALANLPASFHARLIEAYRSLKSAYTNGQFDACGLRAGKFCEIMVRLLQQMLTSKHIPFGQKVPNFDQECENLEKTPQAAGPESLRVIMPRALAYTYTLRNKRGIGHVGGDLDANAIDAAVMVRIADWCLCELIRVSHSLSLEEAQAILDAITERQLPQVWSVVGKKRVLDHTLDYKSQTLLLLYSDANTSILVEDLFSWTEHSNITNYKRDVLRPLHKQRLVEYDRETGTVSISPTGTQMVEAWILARQEGKTNAAIAMPAKARRRRSA